ncbi:ABC transporter ATP-binding protein [Coralliovum pocilloporae]|uniref:ABC transporter ATP-binding protein n=1 Tax=Coralliovum pocilloporae TaxID=3066369 RepID=UPI0033078D3A
MIRFENVSKSYRIKNSRKVILKDFNLVLPRDRNMALIGRNGAGKSTIMRLIAGAEQPDRGHIYRDANVSWPIGFSGGLAATMSGLENTRFVARIYGVDTDELVDYVRDFADIGAYFYSPVSTYSSGMKSKVAFGISMGIQFDTYLIDEVTAVGDAHFKKKCRRVFRTKLASSNIIMVSHSMRTLREYCDGAILVEDGEAIIIDDLEEAIKHYAR